jgi:hypothetical protein
MLANHAPAPNDSPQGDSDYEAILTALMASARGQSFLQEYLRRNRSDETASLLTAIRRIEGLLTTRSLEPDPAGIEPAIDTGIEAAITTAVETEAVVLAAEAPAPDIPAASQGEPIVIEGDGCQTGRTPDTAQDETFTAEVAPVEIMAAEVAEIDGVSVEIAEGEGSADEIQGPQSKAPATPVGPAAPPDRIKTQARAPFADFYALSSEEKIALFA